jgi:hypothetical protein
MQAFAKTIAKQRGTWRPCYTIRILTNFPHLGWVVTWDGCRARAWEEADPMRPPLSTRFQAWVCQIAAEDGHPQEEVTMEEMLTMMGNLTQSQAFYQLLPHVRVKCMVSTLRSIRSAHVGPWG